MNGRLLLGLGVMVVAACGKSGDDDSAGRGGSSASAGRSDAGGAPAKAGSGGKGGTATGTGGDGVVAGTGASPANGGSGASGGNGGRIEGAGAGGTPRGGAGGSSGRAGAGGSGAAETGGAAPGGAGGSSGGATATCDAPASIAAPNGADVYDAAALEVPGGLAVIWGSWPQEYDPEFAIFDTKTRTWGGYKRLAGEAGVSSEHVAITRLADGTLATAWAGDAALTRIFVNLGSDTDANASTTVEYSGRHPVPNVALAPFGDGFAVGWVDLQDGSNYDFRARVRIYASGLTYDRDVDVVLPDGSEIVGVHFLPAQDRLLVVLTDVADGAQKTSVYVGSIAADTTGSVTATPIVSHEHAQAPGLAVVGSSLEVVYALASDDTAVYATFDLDGNPTNTPAPIAASDGYAQVLRHDASGEQVLWVDPAYALHYAALDAEHRPTGDVIVAQKPLNVVPVALLGSDHGPLPVWVDYGTNIYATPLCPNDGGAAGAAGAGGAP